MTPERARVILAKRELARREAAKASQAQPPEQQPAQNGIQRFLPTAGAVAGGLLATPAGVVPGVGTAIRAGSAGLGAGFGEALNQIISRARGQEAPLTPIDAASRIGKQAAVAGATEAVMPSALKALGKLKPMARGAGRGLAKIGEAVSGVPERSFRRLAKDPLALFIPKTLKGAGDDFNAALQKEGIDLAPSSAEINDPQLATARKIAKEFMDKVKNGVKSPVGIPRLKVKEQFSEPKSFADMVNVSPKKTDPLISSKQTVSMKIPDKLPPKIDVVDEFPMFPFKADAAGILKARRATDRIIAGTPWKDKTGLRNLFNQRTDLNQMFEEASGPGAAASKKYARSALAAQFRKALPETQTGKVSFVRNVLVPFMTKSLLMPIVSSPAVAGAVTAGGSLAARAAQSPAGSRALAQMTSDALLDAVLRKSKPKDKK